MRHIYRELLVRPNRQDAARQTLILIAMVSISGCTLGPNFEHPQLPAAAGYPKSSLSQHPTADKAQAGASEAVEPLRDIPGDWWTVFGSSALTSLVTEALQNNPNIPAAQAILLQAIETADAARGGLFPTLSAKTSATRIGISTASTGLAATAGQAASVNQTALIAQKSNQAFTLRTAQLSISYSLDIFGARRREIEVTEAQAEYQHFQLEATYLTLSANLVAAAIQEASLQAQVAATQGVIETQRKILGIIQGRLAAGAVSGSEIATQETALAQTIATLPSLQQGLMQQRNLINMMLGQFPNHRLPDGIVFSELHLPQVLPLSLPSRLVEQRPDVASAEAQLHAATAQVGIAAANMLPQLSLSAGYGSIGFGELLGPSIPIWNLGANLSQALFQGGQLLHQRRAAEAGLLAAAAQYRSSVLSAFRDVANALAALEMDADALGAQKLADQASAASLSIAESQYRAGATSFLTLLNAQTARTQVKIALIKAQTNQYLDTVALYQALGGGWWNRDDTASSLTKG